MKSPSQSSQTPCLQPPASRIRLSQEQGLLSRVENSASARPRLCMRNARRNSSNRASCTTLRLRPGPDRTSEGLRRLAMVLPSLDPHRLADGCWRGACGVFDSGPFALIVRCQPSRSAGGTCEAKKQTENVAVNALPSKTKENYVTITYAGAWQCHLDWGRLGRLPARHYRSDSIASRLTAEPYRRRQ